MSHSNRSYFAPEPRSASSVTTTYERDEDEVPASAGKEQAGAEEAPFLANGSGRAALATVGARSDEAAAPSWQAGPSILSYCISSLSMTVANKFLVLDKKFNLNLAILLIQSAVGLTLVVAASKFGWIQLRPIKRSDVSGWMPIAIGLIVTIYSGNKALQHLDVAVYTIFKNLTIILIAYGEVIWFRGRVSGIIFLAFVLMVMSSVAAAWADISRLEFLNNLPYPHLSDANINGGSIDPNTGKWIPAESPMKAEQDRINQQLEDAGITDSDSLFESTSGIGSIFVANSGYSWMALNCFATAGYLLLMRKRQKTLAFKDWDVMYYNNLILTPLFLILSMLLEDWSRANLDRCFPEERRSGMITALLFSGACAMMISWSTAWCIRVTSSTTYSMVGALNKLPLALSGMLIFKEKATFLNGLAICIGFFGGLVYAWGKAREKVLQKAASGDSAATGYSRVGTEDTDRGGIIPLHRINGDSNPRRD